MKVWRVVEVYGIKMVEGGGGKMRNKDGGGSMM